MPVMPFVNVTFPASIVVDALRYTCSPYVWLPDVCTSDVLIATVPFPSVVMLASGVVPPTRPLNDVWPPVFTVRLFAPSSVPLNAIAPFALLDSVVLAFSVTLLPYVWPADVAIVLVFTAVVPPPEIDRLSTVTAPASVVVASSTIERPTVPLTAFSVTFVPSSVAACWSCRAFL